MLTKQTTIDRIEVLPESGHIQIRKKVSIIEDGKEISCSYNRYVLEKGSDLNGQPDSVIQIAKAAWST
jgi:hypothetical protein